MKIGGHEAWLTCTVAPGGSDTDAFFDLVGSAESGDRQAILGGQLMAWPSKLFVTRDQAEHAARVFRSTGDLAPDLNWQQQTREAFS